MSKAKTAHQVFGAVKLTADPVTSKLLIAAANAVDAGAKKRFANLTQKLSEHKAIKNGPLGSWGFVTEAQAVEALCQRAARDMRRALASNKPGVVALNLWYAGVLIKVASYIESGAVAAAARFCHKMGILSRDLPKQARKVLKDFI